MSELKNESASLQKELLQKVIDKKIKKTEKKNIYFSVGSDLENDSDQSLEMYQESLAKAILPKNQFKSKKKVLGNGEQKAFKLDPHHVQNYSTVYRDRGNLLPYELVKRISIQDDLVAAIVQIRSDQMAAFGVPQPDRFSLGYKIDILDEFTENMSDEQKHNLQEKVRKLEKLILSCGHNENRSQDEAMNFSQFLSIITRDIMRFGKLAVEAIYNTSGEFVYFAPIDAGTIYHTVKAKGNGAEAIRKQAINLLDQLNKDKQSGLVKLIDLDKFSQDEYAWAQVKDGRILQMLTAEECLVHNFYPCTDLEMQGYPISPLDTVIAAVTTHINITTHNKLYFANGRASRGILAITSDDVDESTVTMIRQQMNSSINSVSNSHRTPVVGLSSSDNVQWIPLDQSGRDMEFQYLSDSNARTILTAFRISPEEIPGLSHLSRGSNSQALSESNREYQLEAHRDIGIRPLLSQIQNFINSAILPLLDPELAKYCTLKFVGLEADSQEKESTKLGEEQQLHMTINDMLAKVEKKPIDKGLGGDLILNPLYREAMTPYVPVGVIMEKVFGIEGAAKDPQYQYIRDPFWFQFQQMQMQAQQMQEQKQMMEQQQQMQAQQPQSQDGQQPDQAEKRDEYMDKVDELGRAMTKAETKYKPMNAQGHAKLIHEENKLIEQTLSKWELESKKLLAEAAKLAMESIKE